MKNAEFFKRFPQPKELTSLDDTSMAWYGLKLYAHKKQKQGWLEALKWVVGHLEITEKSNSKIWTEIEELEKKGE